jgi:hypothetical protein
MHFIQIHGSVSRTKACCYGLGFSIKFELLKNRSSLRLRRVKSVTLIEKISCQFPILYDSTGQAMGVVCKALLNFNALTELLRKDPDVIDAYKNGRVQMLVLRMDYIMDNYLKGYLK